MYVEVDVMDNVKIVYEFKGRPQSLSKPVAKALTTLFERIPHARFVTLRDGSEYFDRRLYELHRLVKHIVMGSPYGNLDREAEYVHVVSRSPKCVKEQVEKLARKYMRQVPRLGGSKGVYRDYDLMAEEIILEFGENRLRNLLRNSTIFVDSCAAYIGKLLKAVARLLGIVEARVFIVRETVSDYEILRAARVWRRSGMCFIVTHDKWFNNVLEEDGIKIVYVDMEERIGKAIRNAISKMLTTLGM